MIYSAIKGRMNKELKEIKKLYQATKDGVDPKLFINYVTVFQIL